jgi:hypothetical protein
MAKLLHKGFFERWESIIAGTDECFQVNFLGWTLVSVRCIEIESDNQQARRA